MERLTFEGNFCEIAKCLTLPAMCGGTCSQRQVWERLKHYEDMEEQGRLVVLPCKVGDTVHFAAWFGTEPHIVKRIIQPYFYTDDARGMGSTADFNLSDFGKTVFFTREEAEKALKEDA